MLLLGTQLYRSLLKEAAALPHDRLVEHYRHHIRATFRRPSVPEESLAASKRVKSANKLLRQLQAANDGYIHALQRAYETVFGLRGKGRHRAVAPFLSTATPTSSSRAFPRPLAALVTSPLSHTSRPPLATQLHQPPTLPERSDLRSEDARLLGALPLQRQRAIRRTWWNSQTGKIRAPGAVQAMLAHGGRIEEAAEVSELLQANELAVAPAMLRRGWSLVHDLEASSRPESSAIPLPPRRLQTPAQSSQHRAALGSLPLPSRTPQDASSRQQKPFSRAIKWRPPKTLSPRFLRRVAQGVAEKTVVVTLLVPPSGAPSQGGAVQRLGGGKAAQAPTWRVDLSVGARGSQERYREMSCEERWWFDRDEATAKADRAGKTGKAKKTSRTAT